MVKSGQKTRSSVWIRLTGYRVVALKPEFEDLAVQLGRKIQRGMPAYPDLARADFYDVALEEGWAYIHVYRDGHAVYLVAHFRSPFHSFDTDGSNESKTDRLERHYSNQSNLVRPKMAQIDLLAIVLSRALHNEPN